MGGLHVYPLLFQVDFEQLTENLGQLERCVGGSRGAIALEPTLTKVTGKPFAHTSGRLASTVLLSVHRAAGRGTAALGGMSSELP